MKKLMIAAALVCAAVVSHAAAVQWNSGAVYNPHDTANKIGAQTGDYVMTLTFFESDGKGGWTEMTGIDGVSVDTTKTASKFTTTTSDSFAASTTYGVIAQIVNADYTLTTEMAQFATAANGNANLVWNDGTGFSTKVTFNTQSTAGTPGTWAAVPEPTSGLLLLLGMAGLALRRRRA